MGRLSRIREQRIQQLFAFARHTLEKEMLSMEDLREAVRRYALVHFGGSPYTVQSYAEEVMAKLLWEKVEDLEQYKLV